MTAQPSPHPIHGLHWLLHGLQLSATTLLIIAFHLGFAEWHRTQPKPVVWPRTMEHGMFVYSNVNLTNISGHIIEIGTLEDGSVVWRIEK